LINNTTDIGILKVFVFITPDQRIISERKKILRRIELKFQRKIAGPGNELFFPIYKADICNRVWNVCKIIIRPEIIEMKKPITKPGLYYFYLNFDVPPKIMLRITVTNGNKLKE
jgi:hypothetical protein